METLQFFLLDGVQYSVFLLLRMLSSLNFLLAFQNPDCISWAEFFSYENHQSQARTSLQSAGGKAEPSLFLP